MDIKLKIYRFADDEYSVNFTATDNVSKVLKTAERSAEDLASELDSVNKLLSTMSKVSRKNSTANLANEQKQEIKALIPELRTYKKELESIINARKQLAESYKPNRSALAALRKPDAILTREGRASIPAAFGRETTQQFEVQSSRTQMREEKGFYDNFKTKEEIANMSGLEKLKYTISDLKDRYKMAKEEIENNTNALNKNQKSANDTHKSISSLSKTLTGTFVRFRIITGFVQMVWRSMMNMVDLAAGFEETTNLFTLSMGEYIESAKEWADEISTALHLDPSNIYQYAGALNSLITGLGVAADKSYIMSTNLTQLAYDMSSYLNIDYQSAYDKIESGISGQVKGLRSVGVALTQASLQELAYELGVNKSVRTMSEVEKVYLRYIQIMRQTKNMQGDLARTLMTPQNALRVVQQQFVLLGRAIGQVFIPIIQKMIPYIMAATNLLNQLATSIAKALGYKPVEIDYSSVSNLGSALEDVGDEADSTRGKINRMLAPFDDLNVVESSSSGSGGASSFDPSIYDEYITGYDMLAGLTDQFTEAAKAAEGPIKKLAAALGLFIAGSLIYKVIKGFNNFKKVISDSKSWLDPIAKGLKNLIGPKLQSGLLTFIKTLGGIGSVVTSAFGAATAMRDLASGTDTLGEALGKTALYVGVPAALAASFLGPWGAVATVIAGVAGGLLGYTNELKRAQEQQEYQKKYDDLFDGQGISLGVLRDELGKMFDPISQYNDKMGALNTTVDTTKTNLDNAIAGVENLNSTIENGGYESNAEKIAVINTAYETLKNAIIDADNAEKDRQLAQLDRLLQEGDITQQTYNKSKKALEDYVNLRSAEARGYTQELADLSAQLATGEITQKQYNDEVAKLASDYALVAQHGEDLQLNMAGIYDVANKGFDLENPEKMKTAIDKLKTEYNNLMTTTTTVYDTNHEANLRQLEAYDIELATLKRYGKEGSKEFETVQIARSNLYNQDLLLTQNYNDDMQSIGSTYKDVMLTMLAQIDEAGLTSNSNVSGVVKSIKDSLGELKDYDASKSSAGIFKSFATSFEAEGKTFSGNAKSLFKIYASEIATSYDLKLSEELKNFTTTAPGKLEPQVKDAYKTLGKYQVDGVVSGMSSTESKAKMESATKKLSDTAMLKYRDLNGINSPSTVYAELAKYQVEGIEKGIYDNIDLAVNAVGALSSRMRDKLNENKLSLNINTNVENSFNSLLTKLQSFCNKWRTATNKLMSNMKTTMNSISLNKDGKITYSSMPKVTVEKFADGGFPTSGDLFFANENGVPEYITSIGGRSAVANQDQMVSALSGAIITAMSKIPTGGGNGDVVVYIGNDKVYQGQGEYQNRQSDRYGTTKIVKI